jgi:DNA-binding IclR family transcriptional regulator
MTRKLGSMDRTTKAANMTGAQAIRRAMDVVRAVAQFQRTGGSLSRIASFTGLTTSTAHRILRALAEERLLRYDEDGRTYHLGLLAFELGLATQAESQVQPYWRDTIEQIARQTRLTTYLMARSDCEAVCLLCAQGSTYIRAMPMEIGQRLPLGIGAGSLAILATLTDEEIGHVMASSASQVQLYPHAGARPEAIVARVEQTRAQGYAVSSGTVASGLVGVGVAVLPRTGLLQLAISVSAVADVMVPNEARQIASIISAAIRQRLAAAPPAKKRT